MDKRGLRKLVISSFVLVVVILLVFLSFKADIVVSQESSQQECGTHFYDELLGGVSLSEGRQRAIVRVPGVSPLCSSGIEACEAIGRGSCEYLETKQTRDGTWTRMPASCQDATADQNVYISAVCGADTTTCGFSITRVLPEDPNLPSLQGQIRNPIKIPSVPQYCVSGNMACEKVGFSCVRVEEKSRESGEWSVSSISCSTTEFATNKYYTAVCGTPTREVGVRVHDSSNRPLADASVTIRQGTGTTTKGTYTTNPEGLTASWLLNVGQTYSIEIRKTGYRATTVSREILAGSNRVILGPYKLSTTSSPEEEDTTETESPATTTTLAASDFPSGAWCGIAKKSGLFRQRRVAACLESNPSISCPNGFRQYQLTGGLYTCIKI